MRRGKTDANQAEAFRYLRSLGMTVVDLHSVGNGCPDALVGWRGGCWLVEIKNVEGRNRLSQVQLDWHARWSGPSVIIARSGEDAATQIVEQMRP